MRRGSQIRGSRPAQNTNDVPRHADCMPRAGMDRPDDPELDARADSRVAEPAEADSTTDGETHATTAGAVAAGALTGGVIGLTGGPVGAAIGAVGGAIVAAAAERMMHSDDDSERARAEHRQPSAAPEPSTTPPNGEADLSAEKQPD